MKKWLRLDRLSSETACALNLAGIQGIFWFAWAFACYGTVYLQNNGFRSSDIGLLNAVSSIVAIFAMMFWGMISDKINSIKKTLFIALTLSSIFFGLTPIIPLQVRYSMLLIFIYFPFVHFFRCSVATLMENLTVRNCAQRGLNYGTIRAFGSFTFTVASFIVVAVIPYVGVPALFWISSLIMIPALVCVYFSSDPKAPPHEHGKKPKLNPKELFKNYYYVTFLIFTLLVYLGFSSESAFLPYLLTDKGIDNTQYGSLLAVRAIMEIPLLLVIVRLRRRFHLKKLMLVACVLMACECLLLGLFAQSMMQVMLFAMLFGLGNGLFIGTVSLYVFRLAPDHLKATAQTVYASATAVAGIVSNFVGGYAYELLGGSVFYVVLGCIILAAVAFFALTLFLGRKRPNPADILE